MTEIGVCWSCPKGPTTYPSKGSQFIAMAKANLCARSFAYPHFLPKVNATVHSLENEKHLNLVELVWDTLMILRCNPKQASSTRVRTMQLLG